jgi:hypothetical protein
VGGSSIVEVNKAPLCVLLYAPSDVRVCVCACAYTEAYIKSVNALCIYLNDTVSIQTNTILIQINTTLIHIITLTYYTYTHSKNIH